MGQSQEQCQRANHGMRRYLKEEKDTEGKRYGCGVCEN